MRKQGYAMPIPTSKAKLAISSQLTNILSIQDPSCVFVIYVLLYYIVYYNIQPLGICRKPILKISIYSKHTRTSLQYSVFLQFAYFECVCIDTDLWCFRLKYALRGVAKSHPQIYTKSNTYQQNNLIYFRCARRVHKFVGSNPV